MPDQSEQFLGEKDPFNLGDLFGSGGVAQRDVIRAIVREELVAYFGQLKMPENLMLEAIAARAKRDKIEDPGFKNAIAAFALDEAKASGTDPLEGTIYQIIGHHGNVVVSDVVEG